MLFQHTLIEKLITGQKTQTRRLYRSETLTADGVLMTAPNDHPTPRRKYAVGHDYAVCPARGKPGLIIDGKPLRILITDIRFDWVVNISDQDARAEGFENPLEFWRVWCGIYCKSEIAYFSENIETTRAYLKCIDPEPFKAWAITFQIAK